MPFRWTEVQLPPHECGGSHHSSHPRSFGSGLHRSSTPATANSQNQPQDPSTPVSRTGENVREPSCAQDETGRGQSTGDGGQRTAKRKRDILRLRSGRDRVTSLRQPQTAKTNHKILRLRFPALVKTCGSPPALRMALVGDSNNSRRL